MKKRVLGLLLGTVLTVSMLAGCATTAAPAPAAEPAKEEAAAETEEAEEAEEAEAEEAVEEEAPAEADGADKVYIGVVTHLTGNYAALGDYQKITNDCWADYTNKNGGILGKEVEYVYFDCVDDIQTAINAYEMACEDDRLSYVSLASYSQNCIACMDLTNEYQMPTIMGGSGDAINDDSYKYVWMTRPLDSAAGQAMAAYFVTELGYKNPVIVHNTLASCLAGAEALRAALADLGVEVPDDMVFGYENTETNFAPLVAQLQSTDCDCLMFFGNQADGAGLSKAIQDAGWDIPRIGNSTISHANTIELAGTAINGWYCVAESSLESDKPENLEWIQTMKDFYGDDFEMTTNYYGNGLAEFMKLAMEKAGTTTDREAINEAIKEIDLETANGHLSYFEGDRDLASQMFICHMEDETSKLVKAVNYR